MQALYEKMLEQPISRVLSLMQDQAMAIHLGRLLPGASSDLPGSIGRGNPQSLPYLVLHRVGFAKLPMSPSGLVSSYLAFSPLPPKCSKELFRAVYFLLHFPWGHPRSLLATTLPCGARTFLQKSSFPAAI